MPKKSHRVAAKQAELQHKKRRGRPNVYVPPVGVPSTVTKETATQAQIASSAETESIAPTPRPEGTAQAQIASSAETESIAPTPRPEGTTPQAPVATTARGRAIASSLSSYTYVAKELRRIAIVSGLISAILVGLTFVLR